MANHDQRDLTADLAPGPVVRTRGWVNVVTGVAFVAWLGAAAAALAVMSDYAARPGAGAVAPTSWPTLSHLERAPGRSTVVMVAHTKCSCTRASLHELERVMAEAGPRAEAFVVFVGPREITGLGVLDTRAIARGISGVHVVEDESEARLFGAATSGQVFVYDPHGALVFRGGITSARGHEGDSAGNETVRRLVAGRADGPAVDGALAASLPPASLVFGCALFDHPPSTPPSTAPGAPSSGGGKDP